jgi:hypothetical protein
MSRPSKLVVIVFTVLIAAALWWTGWRIRPVAESNPTHAAAKHTENPDVMRPSVDAPASVPDRTAEAAVVVDRLAAPGEEVAPLTVISRDYKIEIVTAPQEFPVKCVHGFITGKAADEKWIDAYTRLFTSEFSLYPPDFVKRTYLRRIVLCQDLAFGGQRRNAVPDFEHDTLYLEVARGSYNPTYLRKVIHHEFFHIVDLLDDGSLYRDDPWASLNSPGTKYGTGGKTAQDRADSSVLTDRCPGFLNYYSTTSVEEDKAEVFANLVVDAAYVEEQAERDPVLKAKVERMRELLTHFCPDVNQPFWLKARMLERPAK